MNKFKNILESISQETKNRITKRINFIEDFDLDQFLTLLSNKQQALTKDSYLDETFYNTLALAIWNKDEMTIEWALVMRLYLEKLVKNCKYDEIPNKLKQIENEIV